MDQTQNGIVQLHVPNNDEFPFLGKAKELYETGELTDVDFVLGSPPSNFKCHRFVLSMASDVFRTMFYGSLPEKQLVIPIEDVEPDAFRNIIDYIYKGEVEIADFNVALDTAYAARKYLLCQKLLDICMQHAETYITLEYIWDAFKASVLFEHSRLRSVVRYYFITDATTIFASEEFLNCNEDFMKFIVEDVCAYVSPVALFNALVRWAKSQDRSSKDAIRSVIEPFFPSIRFLAMTVEQFMRQVGGSDVLSDKEFTTICLDIVKGRGSRLRPRWLNNMRSVTPKSLEYMVDVIAEETYDDSADTIYLELTFRVQRNSVFLKGVFGWASTSGVRLPSTATLTYFNHSTDFIASFVCTLEPLKKEMKKSASENDFCCPLPSPRILEENDEVTLTLCIASEENTLTCKRGRIPYNDYNIQSGKVLIQSRETEECGILGGIIVSHVL